VRACAVVCRVAAWRLLQELREGVTKELCTYESIRYGAGAAQGGVLASSRALYKGGIDVAAEDMESSFGRRVVWNAPDFEVRLLISLRSWVGFPPPVCVDASKHRALRAVVVKKLRLVVNTYRSLCFSLGVVSLPRV
jgi:hypothetical protein